MSLAAAPAPRRRPEFLTFGEVKRRTRPPFRVRGLIHSSLTGIVGEPYAGKSSIVSHLIASGLAATPFLGQPWETEPDAIVLVGTDPGANDEYVGRLDELGLPEEEKRLIMLDGKPQDALEWAAVREDAQLGCNSLVVIDNVTGFVSDINSTKDASGFFQPLERELCRWGVAVVVVHHKSEKSGPYGKSRTPMGTTAISAKFRHVIYVDRAGVDGARIKLTTQGNECAEPLTIQLDRGLHAADFTVGETTATRDLQRKRAAETLDQRGEVADWVALTCEGSMTNKAIGSAIAGRFGGTAGTWTKHLQPKGPLGQMLTRTPDGRRWSRRT